MITRSLLVLALATGPANPPRIPWFGEDKLQHFVASFVASTLAASGARVVGFDQGTSIAIGAGITGAAGVWKEIRDVRQGGPFSGYDLLWDAAGIAGAVGVLSAGH